jgi:biotin carboxylase
MKSRPFVLEQAVRTALASGFVPLLLDDPKRRALSHSRVPDPHFIAAPIDDHSDGAMADAAERVVRATRASGLAVAAVYTGFNAYAELAGALADRLGARGNSAAAMRMAHNKTLMRDALASEPDLTTPYRIVASPEAACLALRQLGAPVVVKPARGAGSRCVRTGIFSEQQAVEAWRSVRSELDRWRARPDASMHLLDRDPPIMIERELHGVEVDVELVLQEGTRVFAAVADNPDISLPARVETSTTYPSLLPRATQEGLINAACRAVKCLGLTDGNFHVEMVQTPEGPRIIEVNARMGGAFVWDAFKHAYDVDLVELGVKAVLGIPMAPANDQPSGVLEARFFIPRVSGRFVDAGGIERLQEICGVRAVRMWKEPGDVVLSPAEDASDYLGFVAVAGASHSEACARATRALASVRFKIRTAGGDVVESPGVYMHEWQDMIRLA